MCSDLDDPVVACLGLSYKRDSADLRESASVAVIRSIRRVFNGPVLVVEPHVDALPADLASDGACELVGLRYALDTADVVVLLTDHSEFLDIDPRMLKGKRVLDTRGVWDRGDTVGS